jgi:hypothetical protein
MKILSDDHEERTEQQKKLRI